MRILAVPDKFKGTASAKDVADAISAGAVGHGHSVVGHPIADGGEGTLEALGGQNRVSLVSGPLGEPVEAGWRLVRGTAVIEMAQASGLSLVGGAIGNDPLTASTAGTGELLTEAVAAGAKRIIVGVGGSATTDGGLGAVRAMEPLVRFAGVQIQVACDVRLGFVEAAYQFGPQKGASAAQVEFLGRRLNHLAEIYLEEFGVDIKELASAGAAGGLAGGLAAVGAELVEGFDLIAEETGLAEAMETADLVVTGEGLLDDQSFDGKVVGGVIELAEEMGVPVLVIAGRAEHGVPDGVELVSLADRFGVEAAMAEPGGCIRTVMADYLQ